MLTGNLSIKSSILQQIEESAEQSIFFLKDFAELGSLETIRKVFTQANIMGLLSRVAHGIYVKPMKSRFGIVPPPMESVAQQIAERDHIQIMPTGSTAANIIGLSTQIPMVLSYLTTGSTRTIRIGNSAIKFQHAAPRNFAFNGSTIPLLVQAIKEIGLDNLGEIELSKISNYIEKAKDKNTLRQDLLLAPQWIQNILKPLINKK